MELTKQQQDLIDKYYKNEMQLIKTICTKKIKKYNIPQSYYDDIYSECGNTLLESVQSFDGAKASFNTYLTGNINRTIIDWYRDNFCRAKRSNLQLDNNGRIIKDENDNPIVIANVSFDAPSEDDVDLVDKIAEKQKEELSEGVVKYLESLTKTEREVANKIIEGYSVSDLPEILHMSVKQVNRVINNMKAFEKRCLISYCDDYEEENTMNTMENTTTMEKSKSNKMSISSVKKKIENMTLRSNHPLQRESDQWSNEKKGNLISDILQNNPIPALTFAEQIINGIAVTWILDGKQRTTNACSFVNDMFKVSKNVRRGIIMYQAICKDDNGNIVLDDNGFPQTERREFDIRSKKFSDLPTELQERFMDYNFEITQYLNCSAEDIAYHMSRYNDGQPMNSQQKGIINLGEQFAMAVKGISAMPFFKEMGNYTKKEAKGTNGVLDRVVIESVMTNNFLEDWKKDQSEMCEFLKNNATEEMFDNFEDLVNRLSEVADESTLEKFDSKNSFLWFGLFGRFVNLGEPDKRFVEFMAEFSQSLHSKKIDGESFDDLMEQSKSTKDKYVVIPRLEKLTVLMNEYFGVSNTNVKEEKVEENVNDELAIVQSVKPDATSEDIEEYKEYIDNTVRMSAPIYHKCYPALLAMVAYVYSKDEDQSFDDWIGQYADTVYEFNDDQTVNYNMLKTDFDNYMKEVAA